MLQKKYISSLIILLISICVILFVVSKSAITSFTHDESYSYTRYVHLSFMDIISYKNPFPNNHILNTLLMKYSEMMFGCSELALRFPNILSFAVYLFFTFLFFKKSNQIILVSFFILMIANIYLIDFFGLARGYGLSFGFMLMSLYFFIRFFKSKLNKDILFFNICALFAMLSNFSLLYFYFGAIFIYNILKLLEYYVFKINSNEKYNFLKINWINIVLFIISTIILYEPIRKIIKFKLIDFGGEAGFIDDTVTTLIQKYFCYTWLNTYELKIAITLILIIVFGSFVIIFINILKKNKEFFVNNIALITINSILIIISLEVILLHYFFKTNYLAGRFALFLFPLFVLNLGFLFEYFSKIKYRNIIFASSIIMALLSILYFSKNVNLNMYSEWYYDSETKNVMKELVVFHKKNESKNDSVKVGITWMFEPAMNYYKYRWKLDWMQPLDRNGLNDKDNFVYIMPEDSAKIEHKNYSIIFSSKSIKTVLLKNQ